MNKKMCLFSFSMIIALAFFVINCWDLNKDENDDDNDMLTLVLLQNGGLTGNLTTISNNFAPVSLSYQSSKDSDRSGDPCDFCSDQSDCLYQCQPVLLRLYVNMAKQFLDMTIEIISQISSHLVAAPIGSGSVSEGDMTWSYNKTSDTVLSFLGVNGNNPAFYVNINDNEYTIKANLSEMDDTDETSLIEINVTYTDENNWTVEGMFTGIECDDNDVRAPEIFRVKMIKDDDLWKGKAMLYSGRWAAASPTCSTASSDAISMNFFTDFVGNDTAAKASVYMMQSDDDLGADYVNIGNFDMSDLCTSCPGLGIYGGQDCSGWFDGYPNPFCNESSNIEALWGNTCSSLTAAVSEADYSQTSDWSYTPTEFKNLEITIPSSL